jgi:D-3-phosphoglycerate dehydrogenase
MEVLYLGPSDSLAEVQNSLSGNYEVRLALSEEDVDHSIESSDVIFDASMKIPFPQKRIDRAKSLKLFITATTGADHVDAEALERRKIPLYTLRSEKEFLKNITSAAEHSWLLLLACARRLKAAVYAADKGEWNRDQFPGLLLRGKTLGIIGCGRIGQWMATYATAFGMTCLGFDPVLKDWPASIKKTDLENLLRLSDFVTLHVPLEDSTKNLLGPREFSLMKKGVVVINTSRGSVLDEQALLKALQEGRVSSAGLDVLAHEPDVKDDALIRYAASHPQLIITPHIAGYTPESLSLVLRHSCDRIKSFFSSSLHGRSN